MGDRRELISADTTGRGDRAHHSSSAGEQRDEPRRLGGSDLGPAPHELLAATLASCVVTMIAMYAQNRGWDIGETAVQVTYDTEILPRGFTIDIELPDDLTPDQQRRLERVADTCPVRRALEAGFTFEERIITRPPSSIGLTTVPSQ